MKVEPIQQCRSLDGWVPIRIHSESEPLVYTVLVNPWDIASANICECKGYIYRGKCKHQELASARICGWTELDDEYQQNEAQQKAMQCPHCLKATMWTLIEVDDEK